MLSLNIFMSFVDECKILFKAGDGGNGIVAWRREAHVPLGGPAGGNGGNGGNIILVGNHNENSLQNLKYLKRIIAKNGENGDIKSMNGANAEDVFVNVPLGTMVYDEKTGKLLADIDKNNKKYVICKGGRGGFGNFHFKSGFNKAPSLYELGDIGEEKVCKLVLKQIADVGIIGLPNAGKSTFISMISNAKPKTANYQFTTLNPILGTIYRNNQKIIFADIPGLIDGASEGVGLGHDFLKHIERTNVLIHIISMDEIDNQNPIDAYNTIIRELSNYSEKLLEKEMIIVCNKMDAKNAEEKYNMLKNELKNKKLYKAITGLNEGLNEIVDAATKIILKNRSQNIECEKDIYLFELKIDCDEELNHTLNITKLDDHTWNIECDYLKYWSHKIPLTTQDNVVRFNQKMQTVEVETKLKELGAQKGDTIKIYNVEMEYED